MENFRDYKSNSLNGGIQYEKTFSNGYGASIVQHSFSYGIKSGLWELVVFDQKGKLTYDTPITDDVLGCLTETEVNETLEKIKSL